MCELQIVNLTLRVLSRPEFSQLPRIFQTLGLEYDEKVLLSIGNEVLKAVVVQFNANQLLTKHPSVSALVRQSLVHRAKDFNIVLDDIAITHLLYGVEFSKAVEQKYNLKKLTYDERKASLIERLNAFNAAGAMRRWMMKMTNEYSSTFAFGGLEF
ncbi:hypothetical protein LOK49_LG09G02357 [Camellia lanceoleosa]|uniref:Uncharacterized protein n=1 Tax=Camellia lanceoleosa TaxID=1840588 RepID=A0ACC0GEM8_9ERIC|nr:hypothetical protein LOK49_LG09G02357 [Camellia lanceoleosa]